MTANQIMIPITLLLLTAFAIWLVHHLKRNRPEPPKKSHQPHSPDRGLDPDAPHKVLTSGYRGQNTT